LEDAMGESGVQRHTQRDRGEIKIETDRPGKRSWMIDSILRVYSCKCLTFILTGYDYLFLQYSL
jgi:hypothetical protein